MAHCSTCDDAETIRVWLDGKLVDDFQHVATRGRRASTPAFELTFPTRPINTENKKTNASRGALKDNKEEKAKNM